MSNEWFETVLEAQRRAKKRLPKSVYSALVAGTEKGITVEDNIAAYGELGFAPHVAGSPATRDLSTTVMGQHVSLPVLISPTGVQAVHPDGEVAVARAAAARGTAMGLSSFASKTWSQPTLRPSSRFTGSAPATRSSSGSTGPAPPARSG
jgi:L-lactate dehydrogenase (cytochrome)/glycolate oxidase